GLYLTQEQFHDTERVCAAHAGQHRGVFDDGKHLAGHVHDDLVGIAIGHHAAEAAAPGHAEAARIVNDDQVNAAGLGALGADARARATTDNRFARRHLIPQSLQTLFAREETHGYLSERNG